MPDRRLHVTALAVALALWCSLPALAHDGSTIPETEATYWPTALAWLVPAGLALLACGTVPPERAASVIRLGWLALGIATLGYWLCGFAFQFGGVGFAMDHPDLVGLVRSWNWAPLDDTWGTGWGALGLTGYMLDGPASTPTALALFWAQLPWITAAVAIPLWSLQGRAKPAALLLGGVLVAFLYTLLGNWAWGGGWLANLGLNLDLGHGYIDLGGASVVHLAGAACAMAGMLAFGVRHGAQTRAQQLALPTMDAGAANHRVTEDGETYVPMPPLHLPLIGTLGAWLALVGMLGWMVSTPAHILGSLQVSATGIGIRLALAVGGGAVTALTFSWLTTGEGNALMAARGVLGALIAASAGLPFVPLWAAPAIGAGAGLIVPLAQYTVENVLRLDDPTSAIGTHGIPALWGVVAVAIFADGHAGEGIPGMLSATGAEGQMRAQITGIVTVFLTVFVLSWLLFAAIQGLSRAWQGEYTLRLPRRARDHRPRERKSGRWCPRIRIVRSAEQTPEAADQASGAEEDVPDASADA